MTSERERITYGSLLGLFLVACAGQAIFQFWAYGIEDFQCFYLPAEAMRHGTDIYAAAHGQYIYPPLVAFLLQPLTFLSERTAASIWSIVTIVLMFTALLVAGHEGARRWQSDEAPANPRLAWKIAAIAGFLMFDKLHEIFTLGQTDGLMLLGFALVLRWMDRQPVLAGIAAGAAANVKYLSLIFVPYFLLKRNFRAAFSACLSFVFFLALPMLSTGFTRGLEYATVALGGIGRILHRPATNIQVIEVTWRRSVSVTSTMFRVARSYQLSDAWALLLIGLIFVAFVALILMLTRRKGVSLFRASNSLADSREARIRSLEWSLLIILAVIFSPQTTPRHMVLLCLVYAVALGIFFHARESRTRWAVGSALVVMLLGLSFPLRGTPLDQLMSHWRPAGGASWCAIALACVLVWTGSRRLALDRDAKERGENARPGDEGAAKSS